MVNPEERRVSSVPLSRVKILNVEVGLLVDRAIMRQALVTLREVCLGALRRLSELISWSTLRTTQENKSED